METKLNEVLIPYVKRSAALPKVAAFIFGLIGILAGSLLFLVAFKVNRPGFAFGLASVLFAGGTTGMYLFIRYLKPENTPVGKLLTANKHKVKRVFRVEKNYTALGVKTGIRSYHVYISTKVNPNLSKAPNILVSQDECEKVLAILKDEFEGYNPNFN